MDTQQSLGISLIISVHCWEAALEGILKALAHQSYPKFEVIVAQDAHRQETQALLQQWNSKQSLHKGLHVRHIFQENKGFRKSRLLNQAILQARGDYIIFLDGDCVPHHRFVEDHVSLAEKGYFVQGRRCFIVEPAVEAFLRGAPVWTFFVQGKIHRPFKAIRWPWAKIEKSQSLQGMLGCNLAVWKADLMAINGFNEAFIGWGREDSELGARLYHLGKIRKLVHGRAIIYHLNHPLAPRTSLVQNERILRDTLASRLVACEKGLSSHL